MEQKMLENEKRKTKREYARNDKQMMQGKNNNTDLIARHQNPGKISKTNFG